MLKHGICPTAQKNLLVPCAPKGSTRNQIFQRHIRSHVREKLVECDVCVYKTHEAECLRKHKQNIHQKLATFTCSLLGYDYSTNTESNFNRHVRRHNPGPLVQLPVPCTFPGCEQGVESPYLLAGHIWWHDRNSLKKFQCPFCLQKFKYPHNVSSHLRKVHLKEKGYQCQKSNYNTGSLSQIKEHFERVHDPELGVSMFTCNSCGYRALSEQGLSTHTRTHIRTGKLTSCGNNPVRAQTTG